MNNSEMINSELLSTVLTQDIVNAGDGAKYDAEVKNILANKEILARILRHTVPEFVDCSIEDIRDKYIEGSPLVGVVPVHPGATNSKIQGVNSESKIVGEGEITFDVLFNSVNPTSKRIIKINIEANKDSYPGYPIQTRGVYYGSRIVSSEYGREFENMDYNNMVKVYSIWICSEPPKSKENSISGIRFDKYNIVNSIEMEKESYDYIDVIIINLNKDCHDESDYIVGMLSTLLSDSIDVTEKIQLLENKYGIPMTEKYEKGVGEMCNLSQAILDKGIRLGLIEGEKRILVKLYLENIVTKEKAMEELGVKEDEFNEIMEMNNN